MPQQMLNPDVAKKFVATLAEFGYIEPATNFPVIEEVPLGWLFVSADDNGSFQVSSFWKDSGEWNWRPYFENGTFEQAHAAWKNEYHQMTKK